MLIVLVHNDGTGTEESANYDYEVRINHDVIAHGRIPDHNRKDGWQALLRDCRSPSGPTNSQHRTEQVG